MLQKGQLIKIKIIDINTRTLTQQMISQSIISSKCLFCTRMNMEKKQLFFNLFKAFSKELQKVRKHSENESLQSDCSSFKQLIRITFGEQALEHESICQHKKYLTYFTTKLNCNEYVLNFLAHKIVQRLAEKLYHLQLLSMQIKNSAESIAEGKVKVSDQEQSSSQLNIKLRRQKNREKSRKVKNKVETEANEVTIHTGSTLTGNSLSYIPIFNSQFNMAEPAQHSITSNNANNIAYYYPCQIYYSHPSQ